ncbi:MAG: energy transducer TonB [Chromatiales bacterium]|nr:energy transducer TonB [Chromatiales bacterium]
MVQRLGIATVGGVVVTFALLWIMQWMIATGRDVLSATESFSFVDFVRVEREETVERRERRPEPPPPVDQPPPDTPPQQMDDLDMGAIGVSMGPVTTTIDRNIAGTGLQVTDGEYLPMFRQEPVYPNRAAERGIEGYCIVEFTVTRLGTVEDPRIIECSHSIFERASLQAVQRWRYRPRVVDGEPIESPGVQTRLTFQLER